MKTILMGLGVIAALGFSCTSKPSAPAGADPLATPTLAVAGGAPQVDRAAEAPAPMPEPTTRRTTSAKLAVANLASQIDGARRAYAAHPEQLAFAERLTELYLARAQLLGMTNDYLPALKVADDAVARAPDDPRAYLMRAHLRTAVHRFADALADLEAARARGADPKVIATRITATRVAAGGGDAEAALAAADAQLAIRESYTTLVQRAAALIGLGRYADADAAFTQAAAAYTDVSPFALAWVDFQRGVMWAERANQPDKARPLYEAAVARLPQYAVASVHLAELYAESGELDRAIALLEPIAAASEDPEPKGYLGELLLEKAGDDDPALAERARASIAAARAGYDALLRDLPEAFADHGAEFFAGPGDDLERARQLAAKNLDNRPTPRAYGLAIRLADAAGDTTMACGLAARAREGRVTPNLEEVLEQNAGSCSPR